SRRRRRVGLAPRVRRITLAQRAERRHQVQLDPRARVGAPAQGDQRLVRGLGGGPKLARASELANSGDGSGVRGWPSHAAIVHNRDLRRTGKRKTTANFDSFEVSGTTRWLRAS